MLKINAKELVNKELNRKPKTIIELQLDLIFEYNQISYCKDKGKDKSIIKSHIRNFWEIVKQIQTKLKRDPKNYEKVYNYSK